MIVTSNDPDSTIPGAYVLALVILVLYFSGLQKVLKMIADASVYQISFGNQYVFPFIEIVL